jgi:hypothetical protein
MPQPHESNGQHPAFYISERWGGRAKPQLGQIDLNRLRHDFPIMSPALRERFRLWADSLQIKMMASEEALARPPCQSFL